MKSIQHHRFHQHRWPICQHCATFHRQKIIHPHRLEVPVSIRMQLIRNKRHSLVQNAEKCSTRITISRDTCPCIPELDHSFARSAEKDFDRRQHFAVTSMYYANAIHLISSKLCWKIRTDSQFFQWFQFNGSNLDIFSLWIESSTPRTSHTNVRLVVKRLIVHQHWIHTFAFTMATSHTNVNTVAKVNIISRKILKTVRKIISLIKWNINK